MVRVNTRNHWSLITVCHLNLLYKYIISNQILYGINYSEGKKVSVYSSITDSFASNISDSKRLKRETDSYSLESSSCCNESLVHDVSKNYYV